MEEQKKNIIVEGSEKSAGTHQKRKKATETFQKQFAVSFLIFFLQQTDTVRHREESDIALRSWWRLKTELKESENWTCIYQATQTRLQMTYNVAMQQPDVQISSCLLTSSTYKLKRYVLCSKRVTAAPK